MAFKEKHEMFKRVLFFVLVKMYIKTFSGLCQFAFITIYLYVYF